MKQEKELLKSSHGKRRMGSGRPADWPEMEWRLHAEYQEKRSLGIKVKGWWFKTRASQLFREVYPEKVGPDGDIPFAVSKHWFERFQERWKISLRSATNRAQEEPSSKEALVRNFHRRIRQEGEFELRNIANMDQTPLPFDLNSGKTYADKGSKTVWCRSVGGSGMDKRQATVQLTVYADGRPRVKPLVIFRGTGQRIKQQERQKYDCRVTVQFQPNAWCDEAMFVLGQAHVAS